MSSPFMASQSCYHCLKTWSCFYLICSKLILNFFRWCSFFVTAAVVHIAAYTILFWLFQTKAKFNLN